MAGTADQNIHKTIVVEIPHDALYGQSLYHNAGRCGNIREDPLSIIDEQLAGHIVIGDEAVHISVVVNIAKISSPRLGADFEVSFCSTLAKLAAAIIDIEGIDSARILRIVDPLPALGNVKIHVAIIVDISPYTAIIA